MCHQKHKTPAAAPSMERCGRPRHLLPTQTAWRPLRPAPGETTSSACLTLSITRAARYASAECGQCAQGDNPIVPGSSPPVKRVLRRGSGSLRWRRPGSFSDSMLLLVPGWQRGIPLCRCPPTPPAEIPYRPRAKHEARSLARGGTLWVYSDGLKKSELGRGSWHGLEVCHREQPRLPNQRRLESGGPWPSKRLQQFA